jgi:hypothetical protein
VIANMLGTAVAEAPTTTTLRTVSVEGVGTQPIAQNADAATATGVYRQAMAAAVTDGQSKAEFLTGKVGAAAAKSNAARAAKKGGNPTKANSPTSAARATRGRFSPPRLRRTRRAHRRGRGALSSAPPRNATASTSARSRRRPRRRAASLRRRSRSPTSWAEPGVQKRA